MREVKIAQLFIIIICVSMFSCGFNKYDTEDKDDDDSSPKSAVDDYEGEDEGVAPGAFNLLTPSDSSINVSSGPTLKWEPSSGAKTYTLKLAVREDDKHFDKEGSMKFSEITKTSFTLALENNQTYYWRVTAHNSYGYTQSEVSVFVTSEAGVPDFKLISPSDQAQKVILRPTLTWNNSNRAFTYSIVVADNEAFNDPVVNIEKQKETFFYFQENLEPDKTYFWRITAHSHAADTACIKDFSFTTAKPSIYYVKGDAEGANDGTDWENAFISVQSALSVAEKGDQIWVASGTYLPTLETDRSISFQLVDGVALYGGFAGTEHSLEERNIQENETILSGGIGESYSADNTYSVVKGASNAVIDGFKFTHGFAYAEGVSQGGGLYNEKDMLTVANCSFEDNYAGIYGGGMASKSNYSTVIINCTFKNNSAKSQGGGFGGLDARNIISGCDFAGNSAGLQGGGMYLRDSGYNYSQVSIYSSSFKDNIAEDGSSTKTLSSGGGGMFVQGGKVSVFDSVFKSNHASPGAGICATKLPFETEVNVSGCIFSENQALASGGGGIFGGNLEVVNSIFYNNEGPVGAGIDVRFTTKSFIANSVFYKGGISSTIYDVKGINLIMRKASMERLCKATYSNIEDGFGGNMDADPLFIDPENGDFRLQKLSPCIDTGSMLYNSRPETDLDGNPRVVGKGIDMGPYEFQGE